MGNVCKSGHIIVIYISKINLQLPTGVLQTLPNPDRAWKSIHMDFITGRPRSNSMTVIFVIIDRITKYTQFLAFISSF